ncbi:Uncharacterised protein [Streptococcus pneumoniae]|nr:Uncharacterised protein [Streptococcus pneumoniae]
MFKTETDIVVIAFSKSWERNFSVRDVHTFLFSDDTIVFNFNFKFTSCIIFSNHTKTKFTIVNQNLTTNFNIIIDIKSTSNVQRNHFTS